MNGQTELSLCPGLEGVTWDDSDIKRFMTFVDKLQSGCWFWMGARSKGKGNRKPYGTFKVGGVAIRAHRFAFHAIGGKQLPPGFHRDHNCQFSMCVNPDHLDAVTPERNQKLKIERLKLRIVPTPTPA